MESQAPEHKWVLYFEKVEKPLVLNKTNGHLIESIAGSDDFDDWIGKQIVLYNDTTVMFGGRQTGGIRVRAPKGSPNPDYVGDNPSSPPDDDIGF
jgi:hypothetical protein